jgi:pyruvate/2-oxoglutarate dehydrogenase complex dihydrolipoamide acyltransferase (E2) component
MDTPRGLIVPVLKQVQLKVGDDDYDDDGDDNDDDDKDDDDNDKVDNDNVDFAIDTPRGLIVSVLKQVQLKVERPIFVHSRF